MPYIDPFLTKLETIQKMAEYSNISLKQSEACLEFLIYVIEECMVRGFEFEIEGFGRFIPKYIHHTNIKTAGYKHKVKREYAKMTFVANPGFQDKIRLRTTKKVNEEHTTLEKLRQEKLTKEAKNREKTNKKIEEELMRLEFDYEDEDVDDVIEENDDEIEENEIENEQEE